MLAVYGGIQQASSESNLCSLTPVLDCPSGHRTRREVVISAQVDILKYYWEDVEASFRHLADLPNFACSKEIALSGNLQEETGLSHR